ncbi:MAG TPA: hypothetical protein VFK48_03850 [Usitatibacter sp.]|nr:hypothetical protein [Usitatibacter sp.]
MPQKCPDCRRGPSGIAGHDRLFSHTMARDHMHFKCRECETSWIRRYRDDGGFSWAPAAGERPGMDVPGRPGTAPP